MKRFADKLTINALSLIAGTVSTNILGVVFWGIAGHVYSRTEVGRAFAELSALMLLCTLSQLNLNNIILRFLPLAGRFTARFVRRGYAVVVAFSLAVGFAFVASGIAGSIVGHSLFDRGLFIVSIALFSLFVLEDGVMTALRITHWVPVENILAAVAKLALLPLMFSVATGNGIILAWMIPVLGAVLVVNTLLFTRAIRTASNTEEGEVPAPRRLGSFIAAEYLTNLVGLLASQLMPLIIVWRLGAATNADFVIPWLASSAVTAALWNIGASFIVESVSAAEESVRLLKRSMQMWGLVVVGAVIGCVAIGPLVLPLIGHAYASGGTSLLRLIGVAAPLQLVVVIYQAFTWLDQRVWLLFVIQSVSTAAFLVLSIVFSSSLGLTGVGWAYLITQAGAALLLFPSVWTRITRLRLAQGPIRLKGAY